MRRRVGLWVLLLGLLLTVPARAQKPVSQTTEYSPYEQEAIDIALQDLKREIDPAPEGKTIGQILSVRLEVLEDRDPGPELLKPIPVVSVAGKYVTKSMINSLHVTSKEYIIRRELLLKEGERYVQVLMDEVARNMRARMPFQVSLVVIVPLKAKDPDKVDLLVITKDIWSLRLSFEPVITAGGIEKFVLVPQETNFLGLHHTLQTQFVYQPESLTFGLGYSVPRFGQSWIGAGGSAAIIMNRREFRPEGSSVALNVGQGLYSTRTDWAWAADAGYTVAVARRYSNAQVLVLDFHRGPGVEAIPWEYKSRSASASVAVTRSFGWAIKNNFSLTMAAGVSDYAPPFDLSGYTPAAAALFRQVVLPTSETRVFPTLSWSTFTTNYIRTLDIATLALQEDYRLGHDVGVSVYPVSKALGSSRDLIGVSGRVGYALPVGDGLVGARVTGFAEDHDGSITDGSVGGSFGIVTPRIFGIGRIAMNASATNRYANYLNTRTFIGGSDRLRGYPTAFFAGKDTVFYNIEYRSRALEILKAQLGGVLFFDAGDAAYGFDKLHAKQSVGFGARVLFPQVNRTVFRLDVGFPMDRGPFPDVSPAPIAPVSIFFGVDQAFSP